MNKRIVIKIGEGSLQTGYAVTVQIGNEGLPPQAETQARLPPAPNLPSLYQQWQTAYRQLDGAYRLEALNGVTNVSDFAAKQHCQQLSQQLLDRVHHWLNGEDFRPIREKILEQLSPQDTARILLQTQDPLLLRLPWYELQFFQRYRQAEIGIGLPRYQQVGYQGSRSQKVRVLAVLGDATGLNVETDCALLQQLPNADVHVLPEPDIDTFNQYLWDQQGWDILFFAGHSRSHQPYIPDASVPDVSKLDASKKRDEVTADITTEPSGELLLNKTDSLTIQQLKHALRKAIDRGLNTAIFNSCDGLGLATDLADLHIPQVLVMREPVPDPVAHRFLQGFLAAFAAGTPFYVAVREAREKLQGLESRFPCATWLPVIVQNLAETPPTWTSLQGTSTIIQKETTEKATVLAYSSTSTGGIDKAYAPSIATSATQPKIHPSPSHRKITHWKTAIAASVSTFAIVFFARLFGALAPLELKAYDLLMRSRPAAPLDERLLIITNTSADIEARPNTQNDRSLSDETLSDLLSKLESLNPQTIGIDIYLRGEIQTPKLAKQIKETNNLMTICKVSDHTTDTPAIPPPADIDNLDRVGSSDFVADGKNDIVRRHLLAMFPPPDSACRAIATFSLAIANHYLQQAHAIPQSEGENIGAAQLFPIRRSTFGSYHNIDQSGSQILLNYRILKDPEQTSCGGVIETPADCISVGTFLSIPAEELRSHVEGKIILIGTTASGYGYIDPWNTPYTQVASIDRQVPGIFLQAQMVSQLVNAALGDWSFLRSWADWQESVWILNWAIVGGLVGISHTARKLWLKVVLAEGVLVLCCWLLLVRGSVWVPWVPSAIALPTAALTSANALKRAKYQQLKSTHSS